MLYFYRIEHKESRVGPYRAVVYTKNGMRDFYDLMKRELKNTFESSYHTVPLFDSRLRRYSEMVGSKYGFSSLIKLRRWFGTDEKTYRFFEKYGFVLRRYSVDTRHDGREQSIAFVNAKTPHKVMQYRSAVLGKEK